MLCPNCETENRDKAKFCDECGFPLTGAIARAAEKSPWEVESENADAHDSSSANALIDLQLANELMEVANEIASDGQLIEEHDSTAPYERLHNLDLDNPESEEQAIDELVADDIEFEEEILVEVDSPDADITQFIPTGKVRQSLEGEYGERLVDGSFEIPEASWRDGHTMQMPRVDDEEPPKSKDYLASSTTEQEKGMRPAIIAIAVVVVLAVIVAFATYSLQLWGGKSVPDVTGMTEADATSILEESGFTVRSTQVKSDDTEGLVLVMDPAAGSRAEEGSEIVIHIATARYIPDVVGKTKAETEAILAEEGFEKVTYATERSDAEEGTVLSISPEPGSRAKSTIAVTVNVAEPYVVPDVSSLSADEAAATIVEAGLTCGIEYVDTQDYPDGTVIGVEPAAGEKVKSDTYVVLYVARARGAQLVELTKQLLAPGESFSIGINNYEVESLDYAEYIGNDVVAFSVTARPYTYILGEYVYISSRTVTGEVRWTSDNQVADIS